MEATLGTSRVWRKVLPRKCTLGGVDDAPFASRRCPGLKRSLWGLDFDLPASRAPEGGGGGHRLTARPLALEVSSV